MKFGERYQMNYGKVKPLSRREVNVLERNGKLDGAKGLPKKAENGVWTSAFIESEIHSCQEKCNMLWGTLQINMEKTYAEMDAMIDKIVKERKRIDELNDEISSNENREALSARKSGEEHLPDSVVMTRRRKEQEMKVQPVKAEIRKAISNMDSLYERLSDLRGVTQEAMTVTKINTQRLEDHTGQRINTYWNAAFDKHPLKEEMPPVFKVSTSCSGEQTFIERHKNIDEMTISLLSSRRTDAERVITEVA